ncbi:MAG TPA: hypothetical protein VNE82_06425 [Candidatus Binataceae bacterium]|nr:hypothetical protein [Candidatus Binataceae bacterium]
MRAAVAKNQRTAKDSRAPAESADSGVDAVTIDPRLVIIARAIGRLIAREQLNSAKSERDN